MLELEGVDFLSVFNEFDDGVIITNADGYISFYNKSIEKIDGLQASYVLSKKLTDVYDLTEETSIIMRCLKAKTSIIDQPLLYRTRMGRVANTIHSVFPLFKQKQLMGAMCLVREYSVMEETIASVSVPSKKSDIISRARFTFKSLVGENPDFLHAINIAQMASDTPSPVMLCGDTGTGKELFAQAIHNQSSRSKNKFTPINCAAIPETLLEGILFGTSKGAFTGSQNKPGLLEITSGGTIFLDEINSMPLGLQSKILRVLQEKKVRRVGDSKEIALDVKVISSVNKEPHIAINENSMRPDLFYRLGVVFIPIPPLRDRRDDIERLTNHFINKHKIALGKDISSVSSDVIELFKQYEWPGNVRELEHVIEGAINLIGDDDIIEIKHVQPHFSILLGTRKQMIHPGYIPDIPPSSATAESPDMHSEREPGKSGNDKRTGSEFKSLPEYHTERERDIIIKALSAYEGNVTKAAESIGITRQVLNYKMKKYGFKRLDFK